MTEASLLAVEIAAILAAAGSGERLGAPIPKALVKIGGRSLVGHAIHALDATDLLDLIVVTAPLGFVPEVTAAAAEVAREAEIVVIPGGQTRTESVAHALAAIPARCEYILVHDAARALTPVWLIAAVLAELELGARGVVPGLPVVDTIRDVSPDGNSVTLDRSRLRAVQTPQGFHADTLRAAHRAAGGAEATDDAGLLEAIGVSINLVPGSPEAFKVTTPLDLLLAEAVVAERRRTGANP